MKVAKNTSNVPSRVVRRMVSWACQNCDVPVKAVGNITIQKGRRSNCRGKKTLNPDKTAYRWDLKLFFPESLETIEDSYTVYAVAWYLSKACERNGNRNSANSRQREFIKKQVQLLDEWSKPDFRETGTTSEIEVGVFATPAEVLGAFVKSQKETRSKTQKTRKQINADRAAKNLANWERKFKLAETKVKKYRQQVRRYQREGVLECPDGE